VAGAAAKQNEDARLLGSHRLSGVIDFIAAHDNTRHAHAECAQSTSQHCLATIELQISHYPTTFLTGGAG
jgi:hypothetical protein